jgi:diamine N-acetyltransferase
MTTSERSLSPHNHAHETINLRALEPEDLDLLYKIENDRSLWNVGVSNVPYSRFALHDYVARSVSDIYTDGQVRLIIERPDKVVVGLADIVHFDPSNRRAEVGLVILNEHRQKGYARQAMAQLTDYALHVLHLHQLHVCVATDNHPCLALFESLGYKAATCLKDWLFDGENYHDAVVLQIFLEKKH